MFAEGGLANEAVGDGRGALKYLAAYVFRVAVTEKRVRSCDWHPDMDQATVTLMVKRSGTKQYKPMPVSAREFIRRYLEHVLPSRLHKVRHFGFLSSNSLVPLLLIRWLVAIANHRVVELCHTQVMAAPRETMLSCSACGGLLICVEIMLPHGPRWNLCRLPDIRTRGSPISAGAPC